MSEISKQTYLDTKTLGVGALFNENGHLSAEGGAAWTLQTGSFTPEQRRLISEHLATCLDCQTGLETINGMLKK